MEKNKKRLKEEEISLVKELEEEIDRLENEEKKAIMRYIG